MVVLQHDNNYTTSYAHNAKNLVSEGDVIEGGQAIALAGDTGRATGPHLHFELRESGIPIDPAKVVDLETYAAGPCPAMDFLRNLSFLFLSR